MRSGVAYLPLHTGKAPRWLFENMVKLSRAIIIALTDEFGKYEFIRRLSSPYWFQALGNLLGFDWHSSGLTTTVCGAIKEALKDIGKDIGIFMGGGKGKTALKTPEDILKTEKYLKISPEKLIYASRMSAKVDNVALQDGYELYHHTIIFTDDGKWTVIQQGMNTQNLYARRYHWLSDDLKSFVVEPHSAIATQKFEKNVLNTVAKESKGAQEVIVELAKNPAKALKEFKKIEVLKLPPRHQMLIKDIDPKRLSKTLLKTYLRSPENYEELLAIEGVGPKTIRALALTSELIYGEPVSFRDPARFSFAHGGKDGHPYPVDRETYEKTITILETAIKSAKIGNREKLEALKRLHKAFR